MEVVSWAGRAGLLEGAILVALTAVDIVESGSRAIARGLALTCLPCVMQDV